MNESLIWLAGVMALAGVALVAYVVASLLEKKR